MSALERYNDITELLDDLFHELYLMALGLIEPDEPLPAHSELAHRELLRQRKAEHLRELELAYLR